MIVKVTNARVHHTRFDAVAMVEWRWQMVFVWEWYGLMELMFVASDLNESPKTNILKQIRTHNVIRADLLCERRNESRKQAMKVVWCFVCVCAWICVSSAIGTFTFSFGMRRQVDCQHHSINGILLLNSVFSVRSFQAHTLNGLCGIALALCIYTHLTEVFFNALHQCVSWWRCLSFSIVAKCRCLSNLPHTNPAELQANRFYAVCNRKVSR